MNDRPPHDRADMNEGPSHEPPPLPEGWIAQWDAASGKYYFVELATRETRWEVPTASAGRYEDRGDGGYGGPGEGERGVGGDGPDGERGLGVCVFFIFWGLLLGREGERG
jgi:hypothetical protein